MGDNSNFDEKSSMIIGGATLIGVGVGFIFFHVSVFWFVACTLIGIGLGLVISQFLPGKKDGS